MKIRKITSRRNVRNLLIIVAAIAIITVCLFPFYWMVTVSIEPETGFAKDVELYPSDITFNNYVNLFKVMPFEKYFLNSTIVACSTVLFALVVSIPAAYAFARFRFRGRRPLLMGLLMVYMIPAVVLLVPLLIIFKNLGLMNTYYGLIFAEATSAIPFATWLLVGFFSALPREIEEAALIDGCSHIGTLLRIVLPLSMPGIVAAGLFILIVSWNNFTFAFMFASSESVKTLPVVMRGFVRGEAGVFWGTVMASATITTLPVVAIFLFFQKYLVRGMASGAVKG